MALKHNMKPRLILAKYIFRLSKLLSSLPILLMRPNDLMEFTKNGYIERGEIEYYTKDEFIDKGLLPKEMKIIKVIPSKGKKMLVLGSGGGREAIAFARMGYEVTALDYIPEMVEATVNNAEERGLEISGMVQNINNLNLPQNSFDIIWFSSGMYSWIPTKKKRIDMLKRIKYSLKPGGIAICSFVWGGRNKENVLFKKIIAYLTFGNFYYERGDSLGLGFEFEHRFCSEEELVSEFEGGGFKVLYKSKFEAKIRQIGEAIIMRN